MKKSKVLKKQKIKIPPKQYYQVSDVFDETHKSTLGGAYLEKIIEKNNEEYKLSIWDTAGDERYL